MFIKILKNFIKIFLLSLFAVWLSENYGIVHITWLGYKIETSLLVFAILIYLFLIILKLLFSVPKIFKRKKNFPNFFSHTLTNK